MRIFFVSEIIRIKLTNEAGKTSARDLLLLMHFHPGYSRTSIIPTVQCGTVIYCHIVWWDSPSDECSGRSMSHAIHERNIQFTKAHPRQRCLSSRSSPNIPFRNQFPWRLCNPNCVIFGERNLILRSWYCRELMIGQTIPLPKMSTVSWLMDFEEFLLRRGLCACFGLYSWWDTLHKYTILAVALSFSSLRTVQLIFVPREQRNERESTYWRVWSASRMRFCTRIWSPMFD